MSHKSLHFCCSGWYHISIAKKTDYAQVSPVLLMRWMLDTVDFVSSTVLTVYSYNHTIGVTQERMGFL